MRLPILLVELAGVIGSIAVIVKGGIMFFRWRRRVAMRKAREEVRRESEARQLPKSPR